ncbi:hypothetical protein RRF57_013269 [Xylaria bambusicola]|uniref:Uncharacterized protein n=1 Tax=Xylaria bambusicola TaxID=326684 RepID=A0AAN7UUA8_9PEZI
MKDGPRVGAYPCPGESIVALGAGSGVLVDVLRAVGRGEEYVDLRPVADGEVRPPYLEAELGGEIGEEME